MDQRTEVVFITIALALLAGIMACSISVTGAANSCVNASGPSTTAS